MILILIWLDLAVLCCHWIVFFFFFFGSATGFVVMASGPTVEVVEVVVAGGSTVGWVSMAPSEWVLG